MHSSTKWLLGEIIFTGAIITVLAVAGFPMFLPYNVHKLLHVIGAIIFLGNVIVTGVWMFWAERTGEWSTMRFASLGVGWADVFFTAPGVMLLFVNGFSMAPTWGGLTTSWITLALTLFLLSGAIWIAFLIRYQDKLIHISLEDSANSETLRQEFIRILHRWYLLGTIAIILPLGSLGLMVLKPNLW